MNQMQGPKNQVDLAVDFISAEMTIKPDIAMILGSGLGALSEEVEGVTIPYEDIQGFPVSTAPSHSGHLHIGSLCGRDVVLMSGRVHMYEGYSAQEVAFPVNVMASLGVQTLIVTNASGGIRADYTAGDIVLIEDHLSLPGLAGHDPTRGHHDPSLGDRFTSLNGAYSKRLLTLAEKSAAHSNLRCHRGVYGFVVGPSLETPAEIQALRTLGCDLVGMSTVPEVVMARQRGIDVLAISAVCNMAVSEIDDPHITTADEVFEALTNCAPKLHTLIRDLLPELP
ncbi:MAG: purine-nucleoside phosphorylase [Pseudomonadota bacterium]